MTDWIEWHGGAQPVADDVVVEVVLACETFADHDPEPAPAKEWRWQHDGRGADIIAYRIVSQDSELDRNAKLFCDLKSDEEKASFFLSGRGYETGVIAKAIQNDVAMAYTRCAEGRKELDRLRGDIEAWKMHASLSEISLQNREDMIETLRAENARLREALQAVLDSPGLDSKYEIQQHIRVALGGQEHD